MAKVSSATRLAWPCSTYCTARATTSSASSSRSICLNSTEKTCDDCRCTSARTASRLCSGGGAAALLQRSSDRRRVCDLRPRLQAPGGGHRLEAKRSPVHVRPDQGMVEDQKPCRSGSAAIRGGHFLR